MITVKEGRGGRRRTSRDGPLHVRSPPGASTSVPGGGGCPRSARELERLARLPSVRLSEPALPKKDDQKTSAAEGEEKDRGRRTRNAPLEAVNRPRRTLVAVVVKVEAVFAGGGALE